MGATKHGFRPKGKFTPTYNSWRQMRQRCLNPNARGYNLYGGRGIDIDPRWDNFEAFLYDMGVRPPDCQLDRIDPTKGYWPDNCRWLQKEENFRNAARNTNRKRWGT